MKTVLLTGASGFVGRQVARSLLLQGMRLKIVLRPGAFARTGLDAADVVVIETDDVFAESAAWWSENLCDVDTVVHAAWYVEPGKYLDSILNVACARGSLALADACLLSGVGQFIGIGTCFEYRLPNADITADSELGPVTLYAAAKLALHRMLQNRFKGSGTTLTWARLFYLHGEGEHPARLFPTLHRTLAAGQPMALSSGDKVRDFLDVAEAGRLIATLGMTGQGGVANICSGRTTTIRQVAEDIADRYGRRDLLTFGMASVHPRDPAAVAGTCNVLMS